MQLIFLLISSSSFLSPISFSSSPFLSPIFFPLCLAFCYIGNKIYYRHLFNVEPFLNCTVFHSSNPWKISSYLIVYQIQFQEKIPGKVTTLNLFSETSKWKDIPKSVSYKCFMIDTGHHFFSFWVLFLLSSFQHNQNIGFGSCTNFMPQIAIKNFRSWNFCPRSHRISGIFRTHKTSERLFEE